MFDKVGIGRIEHRIIDIRLQHSRFEIVYDQVLGHSTVELDRLYIRGDEMLFILAMTELNKG